MIESRRTKLADWTDLQYLVELARHGKLSSAANALGVTHATVSRRIASLEQSFGRPLFKREAGRYVPTAAGQPIVELAAKMEEPALRIARTMAGLLPDVAGAVRITATEMVATELVGPAIAKLRTSHPGIDVELIVSPQNLSLARRDADIALRLGRPVQGELVCRKLGRIGYYRYAARHYIDGRPENEWAYIGYCNVSPELPEVREFDRVFGKAPVAMRTNVLGARRAAVASGVGIGLLPKLVVHESMGLTRLDSKPAVERELWLVMHVGMRDVPRIKAVADLLAGAVKCEQKRMI